MTDPAMSSSALVSIHTTDAARNRLRGRYRSEAIFRGLGLAAIIVSVTFLVLLLSTIVFKGIPAFSYNFAALNYDMGDLDPQDRDALAKADYDGFIRDTLRAEFPYITSRGDRRILSSLISSGAPLILREQVLARPDDIGKPGAFSVPISDFGDLYLKGMITSSEYEAGGVDAELTISEDQATATLVTPTPRFSDIVAEVAARFRAEAAALRNQAAGQIRSRDKTEADLVALRIRIETAFGDEKTRLETQSTSVSSALAVVRQQIANFQAAARDLETRADLIVGTGDTLTVDDASVLIYGNDGVMKVDRIDGESARGDVLVPFSSTGPMSEWKIRVLPVPEGDRKFTDKEIVWTDQLVEHGLISSSFNWLFMTRGASREPEMAGVWGALVGTALTLTVTLALAFPLGVAAAIYLEEFAPRNRWTMLIEVNINNLAAVPSIVFGLLGLAVFLNFFGLDRSAPYVGGMVLALMVLPTFIIAGRAALRAVPPSIREAALGIGASRVQTVQHHVLPLAMPGILTGTIIGMAHALGETAPLLMIGMVAFVVDIPSSFSSPATLLPVQIFMWADFPEPAFEQRTSAAILVLLAFLVLMNALAVFLRKRFERRW